MKRIQNYTELAKALNVSRSTINRRRKEPDAPKSMDVAAWREYLADSEKPKGRRPGTQTATAQELRDMLVKEQTRKEAALASLRELELELKAKNMVPETEAAETIARLITPLRRLLDALPRAAASMANPGKPMLAERAIRQALDERVWGQMESIMRENNYCPPGEWSN